MGTPKIEVHFLTIVLDGMPFIAEHYHQFRQLQMPWFWHVIDGVSAPESCTSWCAPIEPRLSNDGTLEYLTELAKSDQRVRLYKSEWWHGKIEKVNAPLKYIWTPGLLWEIDCDELWTASQITKMVQMFERNPSRNCAYFWCRYFVGPDVVITTRDTYGNHSAYEWHRVWRFTPGMRFASHEPPAIQGMIEQPFTHSETEKEGLVFDHYAYATETQVAFKERFYGSTNNKNGALYAGAVAGWMKLQKNRKWPVKLADFLPWVGNEAIADKI